MTDPSTLLRELAGTVCRCGASKRSNWTFCAKCWAQLSAGTQYGLWQRIGSGYEEAYAEACRILDGVTELSKERQV